MRTSDFLSLTRPLPSVFVILSVKKNSNLVIHKSEDRKINYGPRADGKKKKYENNKKYYAFYTYILCTKRKKTSFIFVVLQHNTV